MRATVVGAGVVGLTSAVTLAERGAEVTLVERSHELGGNASWLAGGMLAPFCEGESAPQSVVELGQGAIDWWDARVPGVVRKGTLVVAPPRDVSEIDRFAARTKSHARVDEARIAELEPDLAGRFRKGLFFAGEGHLDPRVALSRADRPPSRERRRDPLWRGRRRPWPTRTSSWIAVAGRPARRFLNCAACAAK